MSRSRYSHLHSRDAIAEAFVELTRNAHEVTLRFEGHAVHYPISVVSVDRDEGRCLLDITGMGDVDRALSEQTSFVIHARQHSAALRCAPMRAEAVLRRADRTGLRCALPEWLTSSLRRSYFRAALSEHMAVTVILQARDGRRWQTRLCDLSIGGCLLELPIGKGTIDNDTTALEVNGAHYRLRALFPNGEIFEASSYIRHVRVNETGKRLQIGMGFDIGLQQREREVWFYVREIEREALRQAHGPFRLLPLAPSPLFRGEADESTGNDPDGRPSRA